MLIVSTQCHAILTTCFILLDLVHSSLSNFTATFPPVLPADLQALFFTAPGGNAFADNDGLYGVAADFRRRGADDVITYRLPVAFDCARYGGDDESAEATVDDSEPRMQVRSMSYDPVSGYVLLDIAASDDWSFTLARGRPCDGGKTEERTPGSETNWQQQQQQQD